MTFQSAAEFNLLHVEDNELDARALQRAVKKLEIKFPLSWARDGVEALEMLERETRQNTKPPQTVVLLDINMPRMNGIEFLQALRQNPDLRHMPVFVLTTSDRPADIRDAYEHNIAGYIVKPVGSGPYVERISRLHEFLSIIELPRAK